MAPSGGQICNTCKWCHLVAIFATYASGAIRWPNMQLMGSADNGTMYRKSYVENPENIEFTQKTLLEQLGSDPLAIEDRIRS